MENFCWRAVLAISLISLVVGAIVAYLGFRAETVVWPETEARLTAMQDTENKNCRAHAATAEENRECDSLATELAFSQLLVRSEALDGYRHWQIFGGLVALALPLTLFGLFFFIRWILTGRWKSATPETETQESGASQ